MRQDGASKDADRTARAATRSELYAWFAHAYSYPDAGWVAAIRAGAVAARLKALCTALALEPPLAPDCAALADAGTGDDDLAVEYTRLFDTGPVSLHGGHHHGARMQVMEEVLRFYEHFGLAPDPARNELPDHLVSELEFMHYLAHREAAASSSGHDPGPFRRAQRDYLARQLGRWAPHLHGHLLEQGALPFFVEVARLLAGFLESERDLLGAARAA